MKSFRRLKQMRKWMSMLMLSTAMIVLTVGCNSTKSEVVQNIEESPQEAVSAQVENTKEVINKQDDINYLEGLNIANQYTLELASGNIDIEIYVSAEVDEVTGEILLDDGQEWALIARIGDTIYPLVERTYIQNGKLNYTVYTDYNQEGMPHIIAQMSSGAGIIYYDCSYDEVSQTFSREMIFEADNINMLSTY